MKDSIAKHFYAPTLVVTLIMVAIISIVDLNEFVLLTNFMSMEAIAEIKLVSYIYVFVICFFVLEIAYGDKELEYVRIMDIIIADGAYILFFIYKLLV